MEMIGPHVDGSVGSKLWDRKGAVERWYYLCWSVPSGVSCAEGRRCWGFCYCKHVSVRSEEVNALCGLCME